MEKGQPMTISQPRTSTRQYQVWSSGGGTQSTAIAILILQGRLPRPDRAVIADTGRETGETWDYLDQVVNPALAKIDFQVERIRMAEPPPLFNSKGTLLIPAYVTGEAEAKFANFCSSYWKRDRVKQWANAEGLTPAINWIGYSTDEMRRVTTPRAANWLVEYPLIFKVRMSRQECVNLIEDYGWPRAPKSSCWLCPNRRNPQWRHLRDNRPEEFEKAVAADYKMRERQPDAYLHDSCVPLDKANLGEPSSDLVQIGLGCDSGDCFV